MISRRLFLLLPAAARGVFAQKTTTPPRPVVPSYQQLRFPPLRPVELPKVEAVTLSNGMHVLLLEHHELPLVSGSALIRTGSLLDPPEKVGLAEITGEVLRTGGTSKHTGEEIDRQLENLAASIESSIGTTAGSLSFNCLKEDLGAVLELFREILTDPAFRQDKLELAKTQRRSLIARRNDNPSAIASREFRQIVYGRQTPYGWRMEYEHLERIQQDDLARFYQRYYFPKNILLAVLGDFDARQLRQQLETLFHDWNPEQAPVPDFPPVTAEPRAKVYLAEKTDVNQTFFRLGHLGSRFNDEDYPALAVMADILGGGFSSRLFVKVRTQLGYAYAIGANWGADYLHPGLFQIFGSTRSESTTETLRVILEEVERIRSQEVTEEELQRAKDTVLNSFVFNFDEPGKVLSRLARYRYYGYPDDFIFRYQKAVAAVTRQDVLRVARKWIQPDRLVIVAVGNPERFDQPLSSLGLPVENIDLTIPPPPGRQPRPAPQPSQEQ